MCVHSNMAAPTKPATSSTVIENVESLTDLEDIKNALDALDDEEEQVSKDLDALLEHQRMLETKMSGLHKMLPNLQLLEGDSKQLAGMISFTSTLAENVSSKVRQLDLAKSQVTGCLTRVEDILDLKFCTDGVQSALQMEDYETAAGHIHRFRSLDVNILRMTSDVAEGSQLEVSFKLLHESEDKLKAIVHNKFDAAVHSADLASVERFFKIFPLLGLHDEGLTKYGKFLASQLSEKAENDLKLALVSDADDKRANVLYADTLTLLFESIAKVVDVQQPLVETYYGPGKVFVLLKWVQRACDRQARKLVEHFKKKREFDSKSQQVQQSTMFHKQAASEKLDPKELDVLLSELVLLSARTELYLRFLKRRSTADMEVAEQQDDIQQEKENDIGNFFTNCELSRLMQELIGNYIMMEEYFMREMVLKAVSMDSTEDGQLTSSMVDDTFFIVKKCVRRAISSSSVDGVCAMLNHACTTLEQDFREVLFSQLRAGFPSGFDLTQAYNLVQSSIQTGKLQSSDVEKEKAKAVFLVTLNNAETSCDYLQKLKSSLEEEVSKLYSQAVEQNRAKLESCLSDLLSVSNRFKEAVEFGFSQLHSSAVKPRIKPIVDTFLSTNHNITEDEFSNYEANDPWVQNFIVSLDTLLATFKATLTSTNYDAFVSLVTNEITTTLEKAVMKSVFNRLGGLQFDKELRSLVAYLTSVTTWTIRDKFARLTQMATILNMEKVTEIVDYWGPNSGPLTWRLTPTEVRQVLSLRIDFRSEDIKRLKL